MNNEVKKYSQIILINEKLIIYLQIEQTILCDLLLK